MVDRQDYVHGLDVSASQKSVDWRAVARAGYVYCFVKATEGQTHTSPTVELHATGVHSRSADNGAPALLLGYYHFATPDTARRDAEREARHFVRTTERLPPSTLRPVLDLEAGKDQHTRGTLTRWALDWLGEVEAMMGVRPILYAGSYLRRVDALAFDTYPLWVSHYPATKLAPLALHRSLRDSRLDDGRGPSRPDGLGWACWQWTSSGRVPGIDGRVDLNIAPSLEPLLWRRASTAAVAVAGALH